MVDMLRDRAGGEISGVMLRPTTEQMAKWGSLALARLMDSVEQCNAAVTTYWVPFSDGEELINNVGTVGLFIHFIISFVHSFNPSLFHSTQIHLLLRLPMV